MNREGRVSCGALLNPGGGTYTPSVYQMTTGTGLAAHGSADVLPNVHTHVIVGGLSPATVYDIYCYGEDLALNGIGVAGIAASRQAGIATASGGDYTPPVLHYISPFEVIENRVITVYIRLSEDGTVWCVARRDSVWGTAVPSASEIKGNGNVDAWAVMPVAAANLYETPVRIDGLLEDTVYSVYCFAEDMSGNGIDGSPAFVPDPQAVNATARRGLRTLRLLSASSFRLRTPAGEAAYSVEPATWNRQLPRRAVSGCQERGDLESWSAPLELRGALLLGPGASASAWGCARLPPAPRSGGPFVAMLMRGRCTFAEKAARAQRAGYDGVLVVDQQPGLAAGVLPDMTAEERDSAMEIPGWLIGQSAGQAVLSALATSAEPVMVDVADTRRKPRLGDFQSDEFGLRLYALQ